MKTLGRNVYPGFVGMLFILFVLGCDNPAGSPGNDSSPGVLPPPRHGPLSSYLGINIHWDYQDTDRLEEIFQDLHSLGVRMVRIDWEWRTVEPAAPQNGEREYDWAKLDTMMALAYKYHLDIYPMVIYPPDWAADGTPTPGHYTVPPKLEKYDDYAEFTVASIERFGPGGNAPGSFRPITYWEIWNEPNTQYFWSPGAGGSWNAETAAEEFVALLKTTAAAVRVEHPEVKLVHGGIATADWLWLNTAYVGKDPPEDPPTDTEYADAFDVLSVHPYFICMPDAGCSPAGPREPEEIDEMPQEEINQGFGVLGFLGSITDPGFFPKVYNQRNIMELREPGNDKEIWITEVGFFTGAAHDAAATPEEQRQLLRDTVAYALAHFGTDPYYKAEEDAHPVNVTKLFWFNYEDYEVVGTDADVGRWGLVDADGNRRPAYHEFKALLAGS